MKKIKRWLREKLLKWSLSDVEVNPLKIFVDRTQLKHYATCKIVGDYEFAHVPPEIKESEVISSIMKAIRPAIERNIIAEKDVCTGHTTYRIDLWLKN